MVLCGRLLLEKHIYAVKFEIPLLGMVFPIFKFRRVVESHIFSLFLLFGAQIFIYSITRTVKPAAFYVPRPMDVPILTFPAIL